MSDKYLRGVWTPKATILCLPCHGPEFPFGTHEPEKWAEMVKRQELNENMDITYCDRCGRSLQLYTTIATENNFVFTLKSHKRIKAKMAQTGGMNSAAEIETVDGWYYATFDFDGDKSWWLQRYNEDGEDMGEEYRFVTKDVVELIDHIESLIHVMRWI